VPPQVAGLKLINNLKLYKMTILNNELQNISGGSGPIIGDPNQPGTILNPTTIFLPDDSQDSGNSTER